MSNRGKHLPRLPRADETIGELESQPISVKLPTGIDVLVRSLPNRTAWLRRVITEAAQRELMNQESETK
jgi:hypothetical protein